MFTGMDHRSWAEEEFGAAQLGNTLRTKRLVEIAAAVMGKPHAIVLQALETEAERLGTYRFLRSNRIPTDEIEAARGGACLQRMAAERGELVIPVDQTSFTLPDYTGERDFGSVGNRSRGFRGMHCLTAMPLNPAGAPLGVLSQLYWVRDETPGPARIRGNKKERDWRPAEDRESAFWTDILSDICWKVGRLPDHVRPWLQCDRGADFWNAFTIAAKREVLITVRVYTDRQIVLDDGARGNLMPWMEGLPEEGTYEVDVPAQHDRAARVARMTLRFGRTEVRLGPTPHRRQNVPLHFVYALEEAPPEGVEPLCWKLGTTFEVKNREDALHVVDNYKLRWRIEEFHRTLKAGVCGLESSQLESAEGFRRWAIIHSSVATRIERLKFLARTEPDAPATVEFSRDEIDAAIIIRHSQTTKNNPPYLPGDTPTLGEVVYWIAAWGGYTGSLRNLKPGSVPLARGLERLEISVETLRVMRALIAKKPD